MSTSAFGAKPSVLRCGRCGRFVDWTEARLQVVDDCRPHIELPAVLIREGKAEDREAAGDLFERDFRHSKVVAFGEVMDLVGCPMLVAEMKGELAGALAYRSLPDALHIVALATDPMWQRTGVGGHLVAEIELAARTRGLPRVVVATTNDNLPALYFYQRRGYRIVEAVPGELTTFTSASGFGGIPVRDEIRMEKTL